MSPVKETGTQVDDRRIQTEQGVLKEVRLCSSPKGLLFATAQEPIEQVL